MSDSITFQSIDGTEVALRKEQITIVIWSDTAGSVGTTATEGPIPVSAETAKRLAAEVFGIE